VLEEDEVGISVGELARVLSAPQSTVSRHLKVFDQAGWLTRTRPARRASCALIAPACRSRRGAVRRARGSRRRLRIRPAATARSSLRREDPTHFFDRWRVAGSAPLYGTRFQLGRCRAPLACSMWPTSRTETATPRPTVRRGVDREGAMPERLRARRALTP
jgi:DNA-binding IclR family transcriptional regulator